MLCCLVDQILAVAGKLHDDRLRRRKAADEAGPSSSYGLPVSVSASDGAHPPPLFSLVLVAHFTRCGGLQELCEAELPTQSTGQSGRVQSAVDLVYDSK